MPRPTAAQLAYGSCTVLFSTLAMLLLSQTSSGLGVVVIALSALVLGLLVAMTVPSPKSAGSAAPSSAARRSSAARPSSAVTERRVPQRRETVAAAGASKPVRERA
ncbi:hypothetical protein QFZ75_004772 [Streptomyces sp. V3I8]|jgi:hypothetical protein|uniref:hypothetical protein n=1 Tax=Streptomyces sp. V3I8 TaxID=3042279 RepID=UPI002781F2B6|nr:hypothetical protein [Streptomyces sp. V3I8]MDQ1038356.1 hypothetical protein [Streptomyces sp. V3I8]